MKPEEAKEILKKCAGTKNSAILPKAVLDFISVTDIPPDTRIEVGNPRGAIIELEWSGNLYANNGVIKAVAGSNWYRKFWYEPLGLEHYIDLKGGMHLTPVPTTCCGRGYGRISTYT